MLLLVYLSFAFAFDFSAYPNNIVLTSGLTLYWTNTSSELLIALSTQTGGWIGFGIGEPTSGSMPGSDIVICALDSEGNPFVEDRYATAYAEPAIDDCQNWKLDSYEKDNTTSVYAIRRTLNTGDTQDREIVSGVNRIVWAYGTSMTLSYHGSNRGASGLAFFGSTTNSSSDVENHAIYRMSNVTIPTKKTTYMCQSFSLPNVTSDQHIIEIEAIIDEESPSLPFVHHMLVHVCEPSINGTGDSMWERYSTPGECFSPVGDLDSGCISLLFGWAVGSNPLILPLEAGYLMGPGVGAMRHIIIEIHYDNANAVAGIVDSSGVRIGYTSKLRKYNAGTITLGDPYASFDKVYGEIPPGSQKEFEADCPSQCTSQWSHDIIAFADFLHMHEVGKQMWSRHYNNNSVFIEEMNRIDFWSFSFQQLTSVNRTIQRGDRINTHCLYDTTGKTDFTTFGIASEQEMCMEFVFYYPVLFTPQNYPYAFCGYAPSFGRNPLTPVSICGNGQISSIRYDLANPTVPDPEDTGLIVFGTPGACPMDEVLFYSLIGGAAFVLIIAVVLASFFIVRRRRRGFEAL